MLLTCPKRIEILAKDLSTESRYVTNILAKKRGTVVCHLWTVCEATRKDMSSPGDISLFAIKVPPAKIVPRTMPIWTHNRSRLCDRIGSLNFPKCTHSSGPRLTVPGKLLFQHQDFHSCHMICQPHMHITCRREDNSHHGYKNKPDSERRVGNM